MFHSYGRWLFSSSRPIALNPNRIGAAPTTLRRCRLRLTRFICDSDNKDAIPLEYSRAIALALGL